MESGVASSSSLWNLLSFSKVTVSGLPLPAPVPLVTPGNGSTNCCWAFITSHGALGQSPVSPGQTDDVEEGGQTDVALGYIDGVADPKLVALGSSSAVCPMTHAHQPSFSPHADGATAQSVCCPHNGSMEGR